MSITTKITRGSQILSTSPRSRLSPRPPTAPPDRHAICTVTDELIPSLASPPSRHGGRFEVVHGGLSACEQYSLYPWRFCFVPAGLWLPLPPTSGRGRRPCGSCSTARSGSLRRISLR